MGGEWSGGEREEMGGEGRGRGGEREERGRGRGEIRERNESSTDLTYVLSYKL